MAGKKKTMSRSDQWTTIKKVLHYIRRYSLLVLISLILAAVTVVTTLYLPILTGDAVDLMLGKGNVDFPALLRLVRLMVFVIAVTGIAQWVMNICNNHITYHVVRDIRRDVMDRMQVLPLSYLDSHPSGDIVSRTIADVDQFADGLLMGFTQAFTGIMTIVGTLVFMVRINIWITLVVVLVTPLSFFVAGFIAKKSYSMFQKQSQTRGRQTALIDEVIGNQRVVH